MKNKFNFIIAVFFATFILTSCQKEDFSISSNTDELFHIKNGDYLIPVWVRGNTESKKIILFIQGGPGSNTLDFAEIDYPGWENTLEKEYGIAYYDQRGTGNRQGNFNLDQISMDSYIDDIHKVATFLHSAYDAEIIMMGHSFGGQLMYRYMLAYNADGIPNKYISVDGTATNDKDLLRWEFRREFLYNTANLEISNGRNVNEWNEVIAWLSIRPIIETNEDKNQWNDYVEHLVYEYYPEKSLNTRNYLNVLFSSPYNPLPAYLNGKVMDEITSKLFEDVNTFNLTGKLSEINQNILLITGRFDDICPPEEMNYIFNQISSPSKQFEIIENAGHESFNHQPEAFINLILSYIK